MNAPEIEIVKEIARQRNVQLDVDLANWGEGPDGRVWVRMINPARGNVALKEIEEASEVGVDLAINACRKQLGLRNRATARRVAAELDSE